MASRFYHLVIDSREPSALAEFWAAVLDQPVLYRSDDEVIVGADPHVYPGLCFLRDDGTKTTKNRLHIDLDPDDQEAEVQRILALGARRADIGQSTDVSWVVLADPEGNEFCVLRPHTSLIE
ncbi:VOC family protein [Actinomadura sp. NPDC048955]|uniref:VOC family protein n=1 Tax=Actinomadura TaxID=1988 RepID=UPI0021645DC5|nr:VOC family protein [Actinomadura glauciflava]MCR3741189.1 Glyoxalase-like domain-containing protein [Actinomadura glauciflava]